MNIDKIVVFGHGSEGATVAKRMIEETDRGLVIVDKGERLEEVGKNIGEELLKLSSSLKSLKSNSYYEKPKSKYHK